MTRIYLAGPMTGIPQFNIPAFDAASAALRTQGYDVVNPVELDGSVYREWALRSLDGLSMEGNPMGWTWGEVLARDIKLISDDGIEAIIVLPGWDQSRGARLETFVAKAICGLDIYSLSYITSAAGPRWSFDWVPPLTLFRAWCKEPRLAIAHAWETSDEMGLS